jgi:hypothetical protein
MKLHLATRPVPQEPPPQPHHILLGRQRHHPPAPTTQKRRLRLRRPRPTPHVPERVHTRLRQPVVRHPLPTQPGAKLLGGLELQRTLLRHPQLSARERVGCL